MNSHPWTNIIFDLDGTLTLTGHREHFLRQDPPDWEAFHRASIHDPVNEPVATVLRALAIENPVARILIWSGREAFVTGETLQWLEQNKLRRYIHDVRLRPVGNRETAEVLKLRWLEELLDRGECVSMAFDDSSTACNFWNSVGIPTFHVNIRNCFLCMRTHS